MELIEPELFFTYAPPSSTIAFVDGISELLDVPVDGASTSPDTKVTP